MPNDITTLAIEIQSQEAERNLRTFNELLSLSSRTAEKMEKVSIEIDVNGAIAQLQALKAEYRDLASSTRDLNLDAGGAVPSVAAPAIDTDALNSLKEFFASSAEMSRTFREELEQVSEAVRKLEADTVKTATAGGTHASSMRSGTAVSSEYAAALREVIAAQKEMEKAAAKADEAMRATASADEDASAVKKRLTQAQRELADVSRQLAATHNGMGGNILELAEKEERLKNKVAELKTVYAEARTAAEKFNAKLEESAEKADAARTRYQELKAKLETIPQSPMGSASESTRTFAEKAKLAGTQLTKLARGFNSIATMAGGAIPGVAGLGRAISMFGSVNPYVAAAALAIGACVGVYREYDKVMQDTASAAREMAAEQAKVADTFQKEAQERQSDLDRLAVLNSHENLYDSEKEESRRIVEKLTDAYKGLGIQYDTITGKVSNLAEVTKRMNARDRQKILEERQEAVVMALSAADVQLAESRRNAVGWFKNANTGVFGFGSGSSKGVADQWFDYIDGAKDTEDKIKRVNQAILHLNEVRTKGGLKAWALDAQNFSAELTKVKHALLELKKQAKIERELREVVGGGLRGAGGVGGGRSQRAINESLRASKAKLEAARRASMTDEEKDADNVAKIEALNAKKQEFSALDQKAEVTYGGKKIIAAQALLDIETELTNLTRERLAYGDKLQAQQVRAAKNAEAEYMRRQRGEEQLEKTRRNFVYDKNGKIIREKSDKEKDADLAKDIAAAEAKVKEEVHGSDGYYRAMQELEQLKQEQFKRQQEKKGGNGSFGMMNEEKKVNSNLVKGVEARSSEALALQARNFTRGADPEKKAEASLKEIEKLTGQIRDFVSEFKSLLDDISTQSGKIADQVQPL